MKCEWSAVPGALGVLVFLLAGCGSDSSIAGAGEIGNPSGQIAARVVTGSDSLPVAGSRVRIRTSDYLPPVGLARVGGVTGETETAADGTFRFDSLAPGSYTVEVVASGGIGALYRFIMPARGGHDAATIVAQPLTSVNGSIPEGEFSGPVAARIFGLERVVYADNPGRFAFADLPAGEYRLRLSATQGDTTRIDVDRVVAPAGQTVTVSPWDGWDHMAELVFRPAALALSASLVSFPLLVRLAAPDFDFGTGRGSGDDVRFVTTHGIPLPYEIEQWDSAAAKATIWVLLDTLHHAADSQRVHMYWGNRGVGSQSSGRQVFNAAAGYRAVWHLADTGAVTDATGSTPPGVNHGAQGLAAVCGNGLRLVRTESTFVELPAEQLAVHSAMGSIAFWVRSGFDYADHEGMLFYAAQHKGDGFGRDFELHVNFRTSNHVQLVISDTTAMTQSVTSAAPLNDGQWRHIVAQWEQGKAIELFVDGELVDSKEHGGSNRLMDGYAAIGRPHTITGQHFRYADADIDEIRLMSGPVSHDVVKCWYESQRPDSSFLTVRPVR